ncbi:MAG: ExbD/TolR family protein [Chitinophagales bacterium]
MAELQEGGDVQSHRGKKRGGVRAKKMSTRIDMTPMVDLGFLLVTFFILTTTMTKPKAMQVVMPDKDVKDTTQMSKIRASEAMTILLGANDKVYYYYGENDNPQIQTTDYKKIRDTLIAHNNSVLNLETANGWDKKGVIVLIKPTNDSKYENLVDMLDEMKITDIKSYAIVDVAPEELAMLPK